MQEPTITTSAEDIFLTLSEGSNILIIITKNY